MYECPLRVLSLLKLSPEKDWQKKARKGDPTVLIKVLDLLDSCTWLPIVGSGNTTEEAARDAIRKIGVGLKDFPYHKLSYYTCHYGSEKIEKNAFMTIIGSGQFFKFNDADIAIIDDCTGRGNTPEESLGAALVIVMTQHRYTQTPRT